MLVSLILSGNLPDMSGGWILDDKWTVKLKSQIDAILAHVIVVEKGAPSSLPLVHRSHDGIDYAYDLAAVNIIKSTTSHVLTHKSWGAQVSESFARKRLLELVRALLTDRDSACESRLLAAFIADFPKAIDRQTVYVPIFGVRIEGSPWKIGKVQLVNVTAEIIDAACSGTPEVCSHLLRSTIAPGTSAVYEVEAEPEKAKELAFEETRRAIDLLRFSVILKPELVLGKIVIALEEDINLQPENRLIAIIPQDFASLQVHWRGATRHHVDWVLTKELIEELDRIGFRQLSATLGKPYAQTSEFEKALIRSVHWIANSQFQFDNENKLLSLITSLEVLLTPKDGNPIGTAIAEAVALICSGELTERKTIKRRLKELYRRRSSVSHGGHTAVGQSDLAELSKLAQETVLWMIGRIDDFKTLTDVFEWIENKKLGGSVATP